VVWAGREETASLQDPNSGRAGALDIIGGMSDEERSDGTAGQSGRRIGEPAAGIVHGRWHGATDQPAARRHPDAIRGKDSVVSRVGAAGSWRSRYDTGRNVIVVNNGHRDFVFAATRNRALQLRYLVRLYVKELVLKNFSGVSPEQLLERMIELSLYAEEKLKTG
jgi:hypothetical protein